MWYSFKWLSGGTGWKSAGGVMTPEGNKLGSEYDWSGISFVKYSGNVNIGFVGERIC